MKEEALKLADELDALYQYVPSEAPKMIRNLVNKLYKPLSDKEIMEEIKLLPSSISMEDDDFIKFARAIEERHGIK